MVKYKGNCGVIAEVSSQADAIKFKCPKCNKIHIFDNMKPKKQDNSLNKLFQKNK